MAYWKLLALSTSLPRCIYLYVNIVKFLLRSRFSESFSEVPADVGDVFPQELDATASVVVPLTAQNERGCGHVNWWLRS